MYKVILVFVFALLTSNAQSQSGKELFKGESNLSSCFQDIPLTYKKKDDIKVSKKSEELKGKELVLLQYSKKENLVSVKRYYLISETKGTTIYNFLISKENYEANKKVAVFLKFSPKTDRFYEADCFDDIIKENPELKQLYKEE